MLEPGTDERPGLMLELGNVASGTRKGCEVSVSVDLKQELRELHDAVPPDHYDRGMRNNLFVHYWHSRRIQVVRSMVAGLGGMVLDVGCHGGMFTGHIAGSTNWTGIVGIDTNEAAVAYAGKRHPDMNFQVADCQALPFKDGVFDVITMLEVLEHVPDPQRAVTEAKRCLKDGGHLVVLVPVENLLFRVIWHLWTLLGPGRVWCGTHLHDVGHELEALLARDGLEVVERKAFLLGMLVAVKAQKRSTHSSQ